jgi:hypothetical protein
LAQLVMESAGNVGRRRGLEYPLAALASIRNIRSGDAALARCDEPVTLP